MRTPQVSFEREASLTDRHRQTPFYLNSDRLFVSTAPAGFSVLLPGAAH